MQIRSERQFLELEEDYSDFESSAAVILPVPYEAGVSFGRGTLEAPAAVIEVSRHVELFDEVLGEEHYRMGICTLEPPAFSGSHEQMFEAVYRSTSALLDAGKFVVVIGGDHSISSGFFKALRGRYSRLGAVQMDAHADLRDTYEGSRLSHACVMSRILEMTEHTLQVGMRSLSIEESERIRREGLQVCFMHEYRKARFNVEKALDLLPDDLFVTVDVDAFDWSVVRSTGTPEPGGFRWDEGLGFLGKVFARKNVVGFDVVELSHRPSDPNSSFAVARLVYKLLGFKLDSLVKRGLLEWPRRPSGPWPERL